MIAIDSETVGVDFFHGTKPFFVTTCNSQGEQCYWEAIVDPITREPTWHEEDIREISEYISSESEWIFHHSKFDIRALEAIGVFLPEDYWSRVQDTLLAGHLLASNQPHNLTDMVIQYLGKDILPLEEALHKVTEKCRRYVRSKLPTWRIAKSGLREMPSIKGSTWKLDTWLPKRLALELARTDTNYLDENHPYNTVLTEYANMDSAVTIALWPVLRQEMERRGLYKIYRERLKVLPVIYMMEEKGITISAERLKQLTDEYKEESEKAERVCVNIAASMGHTLSMPKSGKNKSLNEFCFGSNPVSRVGASNKGLCLPWIKRSRKTGLPSLDKGVLEAYETMLPEYSKQLTFVRALRSKRARDTAIIYMEGYKRFWLPIRSDNRRAPTLYGPADDPIVCDPDGVIDSDWYVLHSSINMTGTDTLRMSSANPNQSNISKREGFNLRYAFGPAPGREWWSLDYENIELRIPAYESGETVMIELFEKPDDPPYYGSYHLLNAGIIYPELFNVLVCPECLDMGGCYRDRERLHQIPCKPKVPLSSIRDGFKKKYKSTYYQYDKNTGFAYQYGAGREKVDATAHREGAYDSINKQLSHLSELNRKCIQHAEKYGYVETIPDRTVDPDRGYPILCTRTEQGEVLSTVPLNYHVQSTAMWCTCKAMVRCHEYLQKLTKVEKVPHYITAYVHDELVFDLPLARTDKEKYANRAKIKELRRLMELSGEDIGIPLKVHAELHIDNWSEGVSL